MINFNKFIEKSSSNNQKSAKPNFKKRSVHSGALDDDNIPSTSKKLKTADQNQNCPANYQKASEADLFSNKSPNEDQEVEMFDLLYDIDALDEAAEKLKIYQDFLNAQEELSRMKTKYNLMQDEASESLRDLLKFVDEDDD